MRSTTALPLLALSVATLAGATRHATAQPQGLVTLTELRHTARPLLIFAARPDDPLLEIQLRNLQEHPAAAAERDLVPVAVPVANPSPTAAHLSAAEATEVRRRFKIAPADFAVILIGKDGGEKLRSPKPFSMHQLSETIDAMPMRQDELRRSPPR